MDDVEEIFENDYGGHDFFSHTACHENSKIHS